jgi:hypothetical protein
MLAIMISTPLAWDSILNYSTLIQFKLFNFIKNILPIPSVEKSDVVRSDNRFVKSNPGISATMKCF